MYRNGEKCKLKRPEILLFEYFGKIIRCLSMLCRTIRNDEEIPKCAEIRNDSLNR